MNPKMKNNATNSPYLLGKVQPQATELEEAILAACMLEKEAFEKTIAIIKYPDCFYFENHKLIWVAMAAIFNSGSVIDLLTVTEQLRKSGNLELVGGPYALTRLTMAVLSSAHVEEHARLVAEKHIARQVISISSNSISGAYDETQDVFDVLEEATSKLVEIQTGAVTKIAKSAASLAIEHSEYVSKLQNMNQEISGITTGFNELDLLTLGWQAGDLIILAARPAMGKTALALNLALNAAKNGNAVLFASLEMGQLRVLSRIISNMSGVELWKFLKPKSMHQNDMSDYSEANAEFSNLQFFIDEQPGIGVTELRAKANAIRKKANLKMILIDYLQLMQGKREKNSNREQEISSISRGLKSLAKELGVPIIALSQLSRGVESRQVKVPTLADLRESGAIEQDADIVAALYRPEYYGEQQNAMGESVEGLTEIHFLKFRDGEAGTKIGLRFYKEFQRFTNINELPKEDRYTVKRDPPKPPDNPHAGFPNQSTRPPETFWNGKD